MHNIGVALQKTSNMSKTTKAKIQLLRNDLWKIFLKFAKSMPPLLII